ncbi:zinc finger matrin-type protein 1 [Brachionichthys hirsutus]|uniref:zinc finger matrin-type protein 1 n=1 Tax=Brachionichthys hirsutus TaxID=412623 RepID=UPI003604F89C
MDDKGVCAPLLVEADAQNNTMNSPYAASIIDSDKVINTQIDSTQVEEFKREEGLLKGLLTDDYCYVCEAVLLFASQRLSHYEGKKHAQKVRVYLQARRAERTSKEFAGSQHTMKTDKDRFCELCNMVFSSHMVAKSHYVGKVHRKNLRKQGFQPQGKLHPAHRYTVMRRFGDWDPENTVQKTAPDSDVELPQQTAAPNTPAEVDLTDPNKRCSLCAASFNNPQSALQHYNGRKHYKKESRQRFLRKLADDTLQADALMCKMCDVQFSSVEMHQAHMKGSKHHVREKKVTDLCKSQQKAYDTFTDELSDYIQIQKARGITPRPAVLPPGEAQKDNVEEEDVLIKEDVIELSKPTANYARHNPFEGWWPPYQGPPWSTRGLSYNFSPPSFPCSSAPFISTSPIKRRRKKQLSPPSQSNSSSNSSSYSSSYSSSTSESDGAEYRRRRKKRMRRSRKERDTREGGEDSDQEGERNNRQRRGRDKSEDGRKGEFTQSEEQKSRIKLKRDDKHNNEKSRAENFEVLREEKTTDTLIQEDVRNDDERSDVHIQTDTSDVVGAAGQDELARHKYRKDRKKMKGKADTRTEEEKLWDDSIMGF